MWEWGGSWDEVKETGKDHFTQGPRAGVGSLDITREYKEKPLEDLKQGSDMLSLTFLKYVKNERTIEGQEQK